MKNAEEIQPYREAFKAIGYMMFRAFVKKDENVNLLVVITNIILLFTISM